MFINNYHRMKKVLFIVVFALTTQILSAQESGLTVKAGLGLSSVVGSDSYGKSMFSYRIGATYDIAVSEKFSIIPGVEYVQAGYKPDYIMYYVKELKDYSKFSYEGKLNLSYGRLPILAAYKIPVSEKLKLSIKAGPYFAYGLFGSDVEVDYKIKEYDEDGNLVKEQKYHDKFGAFDKDYYDRFDIGMVAGVSLDIIDELSVGIEFTRGFKKLQSNLKQYNQSLGIVFEYKL